MASPLALMSRHRDRPQPTNSNSSPKARELGTLRPALDRPFTFFPWSLIQLPRSGRNPHRRSDQMDVQPFGLPHPHADLPSLAGVLSFRTLSPAYHHVQLVAERLLSPSTRTPLTGGCPRLLTSNLHRLPFALLLRQLIPTRRRYDDIYFTRPAVAHRPDQPWSRFPSRGNGPCHCPSPYHMHLGSHRNTAFAMSQRPKPRWRVRF